MRERKLTCFELVDVSGGPVVGRRFFFWCPACKCHHSIPVRTDGNPDKKPNWTFDGNFQHPNFTPSVRHIIPAGEHGPERTTCHYFITAGNIAYCNDNPHEYNGRTIPLPVDPEPLGDGIE